MAELMAEDRDVQVSFDIKGIEVVLAGAPEIEHASFPAASGDAFFDFTEGRILTLDY